MRASKAGRSAVITSGRSGSLRAHGAIARAALASHC